MKKNIALMFGVLLLTTSMVSADDVLISPLDSKSTCSMSNSHSKGSLIAQFHGILTHDQLVAVHQYKKQQKQKLKAIFIKQRGDKEALYNLIISQKATDAEFDKAVTNLLDDQARWHRMKFDVMQYIYQTATPEQKAQIQKELQKQLLSRPQCARAKHA